MSFLERKRPRGEVNPAAEDVARISEKIVPLVNQARGASWYEAYANDVDRAVVELCLLRRAGAGRRAAADAGDDAVRDALERAEPEAVIWLASRAISFMDEQGYPETVAPWL